MISFDHATVKFRDPDSGAEVEIKEVRDAQAAVRALTQFLRENNVETTMAPKRQVSFSRAK
jgi:hypothetical protein